MQLYGGFIKVELYQFLAVRAAFICRTLAF